MQTALVTGAAGCVGSSLVFHLHDKGVRVRTLTRPGSNLGALGDIPVEAHRGDICDAALLREAARGCDVVFHTAAVVTFARSAREEQHRVNVLGTRAVVRACIECGVGALVHTSSVTTIGTPAPGQEADESLTADRACARGYKLSKLLAEDEVQEGVAAGLRAVIVNPSVIMGERDTHFHAGQLVRDIRKGRIPFYVEGGMNIVYVGDVAGGMIAAAERGRTGERYILAGENMTHREIFRRTASLVGGMAPFARFPLPLLRAVGAIVEGACAIAGTEPPLTRDLAAIAGRYHWFSADRARRELGFTATPFDETILATYHWYAAHGYL
ncbi:MAG TPA: NAD-dependent epimerase/dehydratase family protein [Bacteroidota bacterium]|nr:NAD-dependent epimerase/dehydratase family protein [Bacteroidota bacterium]